MRKALVALIVGAMLVVPPLGHSAPSALAKKCPPPSKNNYCHPDTTVSVPSSGSFQVRLAGTGVTLKGTGSHATFRTLIFMQKVTMRNVPKHGYAFKVFASKRMPALRLVNKGKLYKYNVAAGGWRAVGAITNSGIYAASLG